MPVTINASAPPKKSTPARNKANSVVSSKTATRADSVNGFGQLASAILLMVKQPADAGAVARHWPNISLEIAKLAEGDERVARIIDNLETVGPYAGILTAVMPFALQILVNHDRVPAESVSGMGVVSKRTLTAQVNVSIAQAEEAAILAEKEAIEELARERESLARMQDAMDIHEEARV